MKNNYLNFKNLGTLLMVVLTLITSAAKAADIGQEYELVWSDEFDGTELDTDKWYRQTLLPDGVNWFNGEVQHYTDELANSVVSDGTLKITAIKEPYTDQGVTKEYTSARLNSKYAFTYGRVDVRAKLPVEAGTWPAIWMLGQGINEPGGYWNDTYGTTDWQQFTVTPTDPSLLSANTGLFHFAEGSDEGAYTIWIDEVTYAVEGEVGGGCSGSLVAATTLPVTFESCATFPSELNFGANLTSELVENPFKTGINTSDYVLRIDKPEGSDFYAGVQNIFDPIDMTESQTFSAKIYSTKPNVVFQFELILSEGRQTDPVTGNPAPVQKTIANANEWTEVEFTFINIPGALTVYDQLAIKPDNQASGTIAVGGTYYIDDIKLVTDGGSGPSVETYCGTEVVHLGVPAEVASAAYLTIKNSGAQSMIVEIESANGDPVDDLIVNNGSGPITGSPTISEIDNSVAGKVSRTLTWTGTAPAEVELNVLWSKVGNGEGFYQLIPGTGNTKVSFNQTCEEEPNAELINGDFEAGGEPWFTNYGDNTPEIRTEGDNSYFFANVESVGAAFTVNLSQVVTLVQGTNYTLAFDASSDMTRTMEAGIGLNEDPFSSDTETVNLTTETQRFTLNLTAGAFGGANCRVLFDMGAALGVVVLDNVTLEVTTDEPEPEVSLPVTFEDTEIDYELQDFGGNASMIVTDPTDGTNKVVQSVKGSAEATSEVWAGTTVADVLGFVEAIPFTETETSMNIRVWSPVANIPVLIKVEDVNDNTKSVETSVMITSANTWETLIFDFTNQAEETPALDLATSYTKASIFFDFGTGGTGQTYYWDDLAFGDDPVIELSDDATLSEIKIDNVAISFFSASTLTYEWTLAPGTTTVPTVEATATDSEADVVITQASIVPGTASILVTAEDGTTTKTYTVSFVTPPLSAELLKEIKVYGIGNNLIRADVSERFMGSKMEVYSMDGRLIGQGRLSTESVNIPVTTGGIGIVRIQNERETLSFKIWID